jgi:hypothetical protein
MTAYFKRVRPQPVTKATTSMTVSGSHVTQHIYNPTCPATTVSVNALQPMMAVCIDRTLSLGLVRSNGRRFVVPRAPGAGFGASDGHSGPNPLRSPFLASEGRRRVGKPGLFRECGRTPYLPAILSRMVQQMVAILKDCRKRVFLAEGLFAPSNSSN